jgi:RNA polymerase sigma factor (sigma-70 family)
MASGTLGGALRHLRDLFGDGTAVGLGDAQLLARYAAARDEAAFEALVARHGPMVLATCRAILRHEHDVEDAFQATFLVLARKARSVRGGEALGGWLHRVAYRAAVQSSVESARRRRHEAEVAAMATLSTIEPEPRTEIASIVHGELDRLPDRHRLPVVLCDLEGLTYAQAAGRLGWTEPALRHRLLKARRRLRERLTRRGVTAGAIGAMLAASDARAAVPAALARSAVAAATGGASTATAAALAAAIVRGMAMTELKFAMTAALAAVAVATAGALAVGSGRVDPPRPVTAPQAGGEMKRPPALKDTPAPASGELVEVRGRVIDPKGNPVAGAVVHTTYLDSRASSGPDGRFVMRVPRPGRSQLMTDHSLPWLIAAAPGFGMGWARGALQNGASGEATIRLVEEGPPIEGRIVDLEGRPVARARIRLDGFYYVRSARGAYAEAGDLSAWFARAKDADARVLYSGLGFVAARFVAVNTDADGRFRLTGIGRERIALFFVEGPTIATFLLNAMTRDGPEVRAMDRRSAKVKTTIFHGARFAYSAEPTQPIEGIVRDKDTGRPIAGMRLRGAVQERFSPPGVETTTDERGRYRLTGLPRASRYLLLVEPVRGQPYTKATLRAPASSPAFEPVGFDIALKRGIVVRGRVRDKATGRPVPGHVNVYALADNPHVREFPGYAESGEPRVPVGDDGRFEVVALPGRSIIACTSDRARYRLGVGAAAIYGYDPRSRTISAVPNRCDADDYHALAEVDLLPGAESPTVDLQVDPGRIVALTTVDPEGRPIGGTMASGLIDQYPPNLSRQESPTFEVRALDPTQPRRVTITYAGRKLAGSVYLKGDEAGTLTVRLRPWGTITGRVLDADGAPRANIPVRETKDVLFQWPAEPYGLLPGDIRTGDDGQFRIEGLVPGLKYSASAPGPVTSFDVLFRDVIVAPGEAKELDDLKVAPSRPGR